ncbi:hypothetical protein [Paraflavitalea sp. CAU 1676]|uniref:type IX secretion system periplasmic lipoprotein PorW/SprE n=1 Tax=Paraflavitalea sp. CAU 1676 TaxID=3032598 RepID=UPI0023D9BFE4|nr:hypothetical protein [Paraflavitalea sp. CAU 1676]MDF2190254.1 hypothetical protein [Paraflavitalea sp. CAU 1676]
MKGLVCGSMTVLKRIILLLFLAYAWLPECAGQQPLLSFDLKGKPKKYEDKKLRSEKTGDKKWKFPRTFTQNTVTKFNWHFNAQARLEEIIERAKLGYKDDFTQLLTFYNYSLQQTSQDKDLDSVIYKVNTGILIHDLRTSWTDNLYMLMGKAYYYKNILDTAHQTFQYINYIFSPREKDGYDIPIGSNATEGGNAFSISTKEKNDLLHKAWSRPPSRNESFIWQIRTYLAKDETPEAAGLIETLKHDPNFPDRLETDLYEMQALYFYKQQLYDSAAVYLEKALPNAENNQEQARWEYLIAQLYERSKDHEKAKEFYDRASAHTYNPVLDVYARLNSIRQNKGDEKAIQENINDLVKMARRDKYVNYRDIIYFAAAQMELERNNVAGAKALLLKATRSANPNGDNVNKSKAFLMLGNLSYVGKQFKDAKNYYDSVSVLDSSMLSQQLFDTRKTALTRVVHQLNIIERQDSLQRIANMPEADREAYVRKLAKQFRKQQGLKEEDNGGATGGTDNRDLTRNNAPLPDLFGSNDTKGDWYFNNAGLKSKGYTDFRRLWGTRPNVDNWRRMASVRQNGIQTNSNEPITGDPATGNTGADGAAPNDLSYEGLIGNLPLDDKKMAASNDSIERAQLALGIAYIEGLEEYATAISVLEGFLERFGYSSQRAEALFHLYYCYTKMGLTASAEKVAAELKLKYSGTQFEQAVTNPKGSPADNAAKAAMTRQYEHVYNLFIEGNFTEALSQKKLADSLYGTNYWTPQLLYIQSVYFIRQRLDDSAKVALTHIVNMYANTPMAEKAKTMIDVLSRRAQIEDYLTKLQIERPKDDSLTVIDDSPVQPVVVAKPAVDSAAVVKEEQARIIETTTKASTVKPDAPQNQGKTPIATDKIKGNPLVVTATPIPQQPAVDSVRKDPVAPVKDSVVRAREVIVAPGKPAFLYDPNATHMVVLLLTKVDPVYITEARNAFNRYNKEKYYNKTYQIGNVPMSDTVRMMTINSFENAQAAIEYMEKAKKSAPADLIPWLPAAKYSFVILTDANLGTLVSTKDVETYRLFLQQMFPGKF